MEGDASPSSTWKRYIGEAASFAIAVVLIVTGAADRLWMAFDRAGADHDVRRHVLVPTYLLLIFTLLMLASALGRRILAGARVSSLAATVEHAAMFLVGGCLMVMCQVLVHSVWLIAYAITMLPLFLLARKFSSVAAREVAGSGATSIRLMAWTWTVLGLALSSRVIPPRTFGTPTYVVWAIVTMSVWSWIGIAIARWWPAAVREAKGVARWIPAISCERI